jgi:hypothetical protein
MLRGQYPGVAVCLNQLCKIALRLESGCAAQNRGDSLGYRQPGETSVTILESLSRPRTLGN